MTEIVVKIGTWFLDAYEIVVKIGTWFLDAYIFSNYCIH